MALNQDKNIVRAKELWFWGVDSLSSQWFYKVSYPGARIPFDKNGMNTAEWLCNKVTSFAGGARGHRTGWATYQCLPIEVNH